MSRYTQKQRIADFYSRMEKLGFTYDETETLRRAQMTLHRWAERECNGEVERDEKTGKCWRFWYSTRGVKLAARVPDLETGAWKRVLRTLEHRNQRVEIIGGGETPDELIAFEKRIEELETTLRK